MPSMMRVLVKKKCSFNILQDWHAQDEVRELINTAALIMLVE